MILIIYRRNSICVKLPVTLRSIQYVGIIILPLSNERMLARWSEYVLERLPNTSQEIYHGLRCNVADDERTDEDQEHHANDHQEVLQYHFFDVWAEKLAHHIEWIHRELDPVDRRRQEWRVIRLRSCIANSLALCFLPREYAHIDSDLYWLCITFMSYR